jgi:spore maturation protein CgeB
MRWIRFREVDLVLRGKHVWDPLPHKRAMLWLISWAETVTPQELNAYRHVFIASSTFHAKVSKTCRSSSVLLQCTDRTTFTPTGAEKGDHVLVVGNLRKESRTRLNLVLRLIEAGWPTQIWGRGWDKVVPEGRYSGLHIQNADLGEAYERAQVVFNDHTDGMRDEGFLSNRTYDALAVGTPVVSEAIPGFPKDLEPGVYFYTGEHDVSDAVTRAADREKLDQEGHWKLADHVATHHSFDARAKTILAVMKGR